MTRNNLKLIRALVDEAIPQVEETLTEWIMGDLVTVLDNLLKISELCKAEEDKKLLTGKRGAVLHLARTNRHTPQGAPGTIA